MKIYVVFLNIKLLISFAIECGLKFDESNTVLLYIKPDDFKINSRTSIQISGSLIKVECSCKHPGHKITNKLSDNEDIQKQMRYLLIWYYAPSVNTRTMSNSRCSHLSIEAKYLSCVVQLHCKTA